MENLIPLDRLRDLLADRRLTIVAERTGLSHPTVKRVADGGTNINLATWRKLSEYFAEQET